MCQDGGTIWECDESDCQRAVCSRCVQIPAEESGKLQAQNIKFTCISCHWKWGKGTDRQPYIVSAFYVSLHVRAKMYLNFYRGLQEMGGQF
jgi:hypothetical protein